MKRLLSAAVLLSGLCVHGQGIVNAQEVYVGGSEEDGWSEPSYDSEYNQQGSYEQYGDYDSRDYGATDFDPNDDGLPIVYAGDGMSVTIRSIDPNTGVIRGDVTLRNGQPMPLVMQMQTDQQGYEFGVGQVNTPQGSKQIRSRDESEDVVRAEFSGRTYRLSLRPNTAPPPQDYGRQPQQREYGQRNMEIQKQTGTAKPSGTVVMTSHTLRDRALNNMPSHTLLAPNGWKVEGGGWWPPAQAAMWMPSYDITVTGTDGTLVHFEPMVEAQEKTGSQAPAEGSIADGYPIMAMPRDINGWKEFLVRRGIPSMYKGASNIQITKAEVVPELTAIARKTMEKQQANVPQIPQGMGIRTYRDVVVLNIELTFTHEGKQWDQRHLFTNEFHGMDNQMSGGQIFWSTHGAIVFRAPKGQLDSRMPLLMSIVHSLRLEKEWIFKLLQHKARINNVRHGITMDAINSISQRAGIVSSTLSDINDMNIAGGQRRNTINDSGQRSIVNSILDTQDYSVPGSGKTVSLSNQYERVFSNGNGDYILTNDESYDPGIDQNLSGNWQRMTASD